MDTQTFFDHFQTLAEAPNAVAKLRETILQMAVQGKLVPQDPDDEPAASLRDRIRAERGLMIDRGEASDCSLLPELHGNQTPYSVPSGWKWLRLGEFGGFLGGGTPSKQKSEYWEGTIPWVSPKDMKRPYIADAVDHISAAALEDSSAKVIPPGSLLVVVRGMILAHTFPVALAMRELTINQDMKALRLAVPDVREYLLRYCAAAGVRMLENVERSSHGTCRLSTEAVANLPVPLPPLAEQRRIVAKVDELMKLCDELAGRVQRQREARERLSAAALDRLLTERDPAEFARHWQRLGDHFDLLYDAPETLAQLRQAILQLAVQGKLTAQAPGTERAELPLGKLLREESLNGCSKAPKASPPGVEILRISAGTSRRDAIVDENDYKWVVLRDDEREKFRLLPGDLLACRFNGNLHFVGRFSLYLGTSERVQVNPDKLIRFRVDLGRCDPRYVRYAMNAGETRKKLEAFCATTAGNIGISATNLKTVSIPVPPLAEQRRIVAKVDHLMSLCDALEAKLKQSQTDSDRLLAAAVHSLLNGVPAGPAADHDRLPVSGGEAHLAR